MLRLDALPAEVRDVCEAAIEQLRTWQRPDVLHDSESYLIATSRTEAAAHYLVAAMEERTCK